MNTTTTSSAGERRRPREVTGRTVLFCIVTFFGVVFLVNAVMFRAAVSTFGGLETESSYKAGLNYAREIAAAEQQQQRHWSVSVTLAPQTDGTTAIELLARDAAGQPLAGYEADALLAHPTDRRHDVPVELRYAGNGRFLGRTEAPSGQWDLVVDIQRGAERLFRSRERIVLKERGAKS
jgi:nitrogen fixation protein FixH